MHPIVKDDQIIAVDNLRLAGRFHWLILPKTHLRDAESLNGEHLDLREK